MSDYKAAALVLDAMPDAPVLIGDRGYDVDWLRHALRARNIAQVSRVELVAQADPPRREDLPRPTPH